MTVTTSKEVVRTGPKSPTSPVSPGKAKEPPVVPAKPAKGPRGPLANSSTLVSSGTPGAKDGTDGVKQEVTSARVR
jgi:hypothetical protein